MTKSNCKFILFKKLSILFLIVFFIVVCFVFIFGVGFELYYQNKIYPGVKIGNVDLSGLEKGDAYRLVEKRVNIINQEGVNFDYDGEMVNITPIISSFSGELAYRVLSFDVDDIVSSAFLLGRGNGFVNNLKGVFSLYKNGEAVDVNFQINDEEIKKILKDNYEKYETPVQNASIIVTTTPLNKVLVEIKEEQSGITIDYENGLNKFKNNLKKLDISDVELFMHEQKPNFKKGDCLDKKEQVDIALSHTPLVLIATSTFWEDEEWVIDKVQLADWLEFSDNGSDILVGLDEEEIERYFEENIKTKTDVAPISARFKIKDNKVEKFQTSKSGIAVNIKDSVKKIESCVFENKGREIALVLDIIESKTKDSKAEELGIKEIIGEGHSSFAGSSWSRKHNIKTGADSVSGLLIAPDEEFSLVGALGEISKSTGYLPELVIKGNETVPEYGGGLCQVGTTLFRTVLDAGLKITARRNHSYRVSYYEPAGTDATIYNPRPDFKFLNDTENYILIQYKMEGNDLDFIFWGTNDGREASTTYPVIYKIVKPEPTKIIETTELEPGEKKCTEHAHNGADAYFDYFVKYSDGSEKERTFYSHYIPWREVCLLGINGNASSTEDELMGAEE